MDKLKSFLKQKKYFRIKLKLTKTNHFEITAKLNGVKGEFILDTGASNSCVGFEAVEKFNLNVKDSDIKAVGAGASNMTTQVTECNSIKIGKWKRHKVSIVVFDLSHVNEGLKNHNAREVDGIIGADILKAGKSIIDYNKKCVYFKDSKI